VRREEFYDSVIEFGIPMKLVRLIKIWLNETCTEVRTDKNGLKQGDGVLSPLVFIFCFRICYREGPRKLDRIAFERNI